MVADELGGGSDQEARSNKSAATPEGESIASVGQDLEDRRRSVGYMRARALRGGTSGAWFRVRRIAG